jgi:probable HAF family extracellular repeat protein
MFLRPRPSVSTLLVLMVASTAAQGGTAATAYEFSALPSLGGTQASALGINNRGEVVGDASTKGSTDANPVMWTPRGEPHQLDTRVGSAQGVNDDGTIVGIVNYAYAAYWKAGVEHLLDVSPPGRAFAINAHGTMVGVDEMNPTYMTKTRAVHYGGLPGSIWDQGLAINDRMDVVGQSFLYVYPRSTTVAHVHLHDHATMPLPSLADQGTAFGINGHGLIVGQNWTYDANSQYVVSYAVQWIQMQPVKLPWDTDFAAALAVNGEGRIVGWGRAADGTSHAVLWKDGQPVDLNRYLAPSWRDNGWVMTSANAINDRGWMAGDMTGPSGQTLAWVLRPTSAD